MSTFVKVMIGVAVLGVLGTIGAVIMTALFFANFAKTTFDPEESNKVAQSVTKIKRLPPEFQRVIAMNMDAMGMTYVAYSGPDHLTIMLMKLKESTYKKLSAEELVQTYSRRGSVRSNFPTMPDSARKAIAGPIHIISSGRKVVGGEQMPYSLGETFGNGVHVIQMVGCVLPATTQTPVLILGQTVHSESYNMEATDKFLNSITGF
jgi:hypothetical protein